MLNDRGNKEDLCLTFASLRGEVTGRLPTEKVGRRREMEREGEWEQINIFSISATA